MSETEKSHRVRAGISDSMLYSYVTTILSYFVLSVLCQKLKKAIECVHSYRIPSWEKLPLSRTPRIFQTELTHVPAGSSFLRIHNVDLTSREDRFTRAGVSYPWDYVDEHL
ncbi:hypothetical protein ElyMa_001235700 [Elysia marginata]|uniref:Uncharacterized protein n=1 Tax=Elysia marginata TaxID=1093978 RepID=A0AAV4ICZ8_9GAST|nr:hypothetical protein ElyMa_001235700 [Elysia marginata]